MNNTIHEYKDVDRSKLREVYFTKFSKYAWVKELNCVIFLRNIKLDNDVFHVGQSENDFCKSELTNIDINQLLQEMAYIKMCNGPLRVGPQLQYNLKEIGISIE